MAAQFLPRGVTGPLLRLRWVQQSRRERNPLDKQAYRPRCRSGNGDGPTKQLAVSIGLFVYATTGGLTGPLRFFAFARFILAGLALASSSLRIW